MRFISPVACSVPFVLVLAVCAGCGGEPSATDVASGDAELYASSITQSLAMDVRGDDAPLFASAPALEVPGVTDTGPALNAMETAASKETSAGTLGLDELGGQEDPRTDVALAR